MTLEDNHNTRIQKIFVWITFILSVILFYSNPDQFVSDNSLFYPVVAENIWTTGVSTFNGYIETNGFQPLWMFFSVLAVAVSHFLSIDTLIAIGILYHLFLAGAIVLVFKMAERWPFFSAPVVSVVFIFMFVSNGVLHNMESALALFFVLLSLYYALSIKIPNGKQFFILGVLLGFTFLSRLDLVFFAMILTSYVLFQQRQVIKGQALLLLLPFFAIVLVVAPYLIYNIVNFAHWLPMSEQLSQGFPTLSYAWANIYPYGAVSLIIAIVEWGIAWTAKTKEARVIILTLSISTIFQIVYVAFFQHPQSWYFITGFINFAVIIGYLLNKIDKIWLTRSVFTLLIVMTIGSAYLKTVSNYALSAHVLKLYQDKVGKAEWLFSPVSEKRKYAEDIRKILPEGTAVTVGYFPGALAYYAKLKVFASNGLSSGLIANTTFDDALQKSGIENTLKTYNITHHVVPMTRGPVMWYSNLGFDTSKSDHYSVMIYAKNSSKTCGMMQYVDEDIPKARLGYASTGYAGIFPTKELVECSEEVKNYRTSGYYSTIID